MSAGAATAYRRRFTDRIAPARSRKSPEIKPFHGCRSASLTQVHCIKDRVLLDPACGSGNFLTETYLSVRRIENEVISELQHGQIMYALEGMRNPIQVSISQFYGIEINDFAVTVAKTALWIAESQMMQETESIIKTELDFLPLTTNANIVEGNALRIDWNDVVPSNQLNYIMGNPPFVGASMMSKNQKNDIYEIYVTENGKRYSKAGKNDYVSGWFFKAAKFIFNTDIQCAFVSTNSTTQGELVSCIWQPIFNRFKIHFDYAYRSFRWDSEANEKAAVHCVIIGFSYKSNKQKRIYYIEGVNTAANINAYLMDAPNIFITSRTKPISNVPECSRGNQPTDGGNLIIEAEEYRDFIEKEPKAKSYIKKLIGSYEFINRKSRYCLWLVKTPPKELRSMPLVMERIEKVKEMRLASSFAPTRALADTPTTFRETKNPETYVVIPRVSSEKRRYVPIGFLDADTIPTDSVIIVPNATIYHFGILTANVHMAWVRTVCGRLKSDYRYSKNIVYNNFPWPSPTDKQKALIEKTAQAILDARDLYPDSSLADLYDPLTMPPELRKAHQMNDRAVMQAYGFSRKMSESDCVAELMKMYQKLTEAEGK